MLQFAFAKLILHVAAVVRRDAISQKLNVNPIWTSVQCEIFLLFFVFRFRPKKEGLFIFLLFFGQKNTVLFGTFSFSAENRNSVFGRPLTRTLVVFIKESPQNKPALVYVIVTMWESRNAV